MKHTWVNIIFDIKLECTYSSTFVSAQHGGANNEISASLFIKRLYLKTQTMSPIAQVHRQ